MKISLLLAVLLLTGCGTAQEFPEATSTPALEQSATAEPSVQIAAETPFAIVAPESTQAPAKEHAASAVTPKSTARTTAVPAERAVVTARPAQTEIPLPMTTPAPTAGPTAVPTAVPAPANTPVPKPAYGAIPFDLAAQTGAWFQIDATDSAYQATLEQINAIRAEGGLAALTMSSDLSNAANARCESFVAGGPFDHSGMTTLSEICAKGPIGSAQAVCTAWKGSPDHYTNIMRTDISQMGVACWFCSTEQGNYTYWTVTFG